MVAVIAYQSLNSNSSTEHSLDASTSQTFLRQAQRTLSPMYPQGSGALKYPVNPDLAPHEAIQGPAQLLPVAESTFMDVDKPSKKRKRDEPDVEADAAYSDARLRTLSMVEGKARQIYQQTFREFGEQCDLVVFGELDSDHPDWRSLTAASGKRVHVSSYPKACNCFSLHSSAAEIKVQPIADGEGWCAARCSGVLVVFVHVPNSLAKDKVAAVKFYNTIRTKLLTTKGGGVIDVVMGDTNQPSAMFSPGVISSALGVDFRDGHASAEINASDTWSPSKVTHRGTNSVDNKKFDVAVYNTGTVAKMSVRYTSPSFFGFGQGGGLHRPHGAAGQGRDEVVGRRGAAAWARSRVAFLVRGGGLGGLGPCAWSSGCAVGCEAASAQGAETRSWRRKRNSR